MIERVLFHAHTAIMVASSLSLLLGYWRASSPHVESVVNKISESFLASNILCILIDWISFEAGVHIATEHWQMNPVFLMYRILGPNHVFGVEGGQCISSFAINLIFGFSVKGLVPKLFIPRASFVHVYSWPTVDTEFKSIGCFVPNFPALHKFYECF